MNGPLDVPTAAERYAARGWAVLPLRPGTKLPATAHGLHDASTDLASIRRWWSRWPSANVGIATGARSGVVVLDVDPPTGFESLRLLEVEHGPLPAGRQVKTPRGGLHLYFSHDGDAVPNSAGRLGRGLDVRGDGGYVVAPPSTLIGGRRYTATATGELPPWPAWAALRPPVARPVPPRAMRVLPGGRYAQAALNGEVENVRGAPVGRRNDTLNSSAFRLGQLVGAQVLDAGIAAQALLYAALDAGLGEGEARATILSGLNAGAGAPRQRVGA
ncbi:MAG: bifunctional DNA primase/polymerase [Actinomycetota bacterium]|nr:bifunctional DNA primase/polymerase [Actinomycetota bacterium]